ncbi:MAG: ZIP family metal transporter [Acidimicrobiales bacterium]
MSTTKLLVLGAIAGLTIFVGLPIARIRTPMPRMQALLNAIAIGVLVFLLFDVFSHANEPVETALLSAQAGDDSWGRFAWLSAVFAGGVGVGLLSLGWYDGWLRRRGPGAAPLAQGAITTEARSAPRWQQGWSDAHRLAFFIALGIGLHNFSEGLAIGQAAATGEITLAGVLITGFALHNGTEGFGIVAPFAQEQQRPSWRFLAAMGLLGGGPTFLGTVVGNSVVNDTLFLSFLALAAGSILYVIIQLLKAAQKLGQPELLGWGLLVGLIAGFSTDYVLVAAGG